MSRMLPPAFEISDLWYSKRAVFSDFWKVLRRSEKTCQCTVKPDNPLNAFGTTDGSSFIGQVIGVPRSHRSNSNGPRHKRGVRVNDGA